MKNKIVLANPISAIFNIPEPISTLNKIELKKPNNLEIFWHVFSLHPKYEIINNKTLVLTIKARKGFRDTKTGDIKNIERRMFHHNSIIFIESLDDLYYYDFGSLRFKHRDLNLLENALQKISIESKDYLNKFYY